MSEMYGKPNLQFKPTMPTLDPIFTLAKTGDLAKLEAANLTLLDLDKRDAQGVSFFAHLKARKVPDFLAFAYNIAKRDAALEDKGRTALHWAAKCNQVDAIQAELAAGAAINDTNNPFQVTPLYLAAMEGHAAAVKALLAAGADCAQVAVNGATPLHAAAESGDLETVQALVAAGAKVNASCLMGGTPVVVAAQHNHVAVVQCLIEAGADVNVTLRDGATALIIAAQAGFADVVRVLTAAGADTSVQISGHTALDIATANRHAAVVELLSA